MSISEEELADMERLAEDGLEPFDIRRALKRACQEIRFYKSWGGDAHRQLERAFCNGEGYSEEYGWPVGDQVPETMADAIIRRQAGV